MRCGQFSLPMHTFLCQQWFNLKDVPSGSVHLRLEWLSLLSSAERLSEVRPEHVSIVQSQARVWAGFRKYCRAVSLKSSVDLSVRKI